MIDLEALRNSLMGYDVAPLNDEERDKREDGRISATLPPSACTMIGRTRLNSIQSKIEIILRDDIEGDFMECGVWRGGASIFMRACLDFYNNHDKNVWVVDSFEGLHAPDYDKFPDEQHPRVKLWEQSWLRISLETVQDNFRKYELLDDRVKFLMGWVEKTLPIAPISKLSLLRIDVDMYEPTMAVLEYMYPKLSIGGFCELDDYPIMSSCNQAVDDYRTKTGILEPIVILEGYTGAYWRKEVNV